VEICRGGAGRQFCKSAENAGGEGRTRRVRRARAGSIKGGNILQVRNGLSSL
jgi:hypothetical protein